MRKKFFSLLPLLIFIAACDTIVEFSPEQTKMFSIQSISNGATYNIKVALPENYSPQVQNYPAIYVLDGEEIFDFVAVKCKDISKDFSASNVLVISIGYGNDRTLDYTPTKAAEGGGGAENFMHFIKDELIPKMENEYGADTLRKNRVLLGHSFGGLFAAYAFTNYNNVFGNYIILSPSLWYDNLVLFRLEQDNREINKNNHQLVFLGMGQLENDGRMLAPFQAFYQRLKDNYPDIRIMNNIEPHLDHKGSEKPNIIEGLNFYFQNR